MPDSTWIQSGTPQAPDKTTKTLAWIKAHRDAVLGSLVILAGAAIFGIWVALHYSGINETAWKNLFIAQQTALGGNFADAEKRLDEIEAGFGGTKAWGFAALSKGDLLFREGKFAEAAAEYEKVAAKGRKDLVPFALYNIGKAREAAGDPAAAQARYKDFLAAYPDHFMAPEAHFSLANVLEISNNQSEAKAVYEKIILLYPETGWAAKAKAKIMPEVKKEDAPAKAAPQKAAK
jgi:tetratricopeptide (TPR) repeat protein